LSGQHLDEEAERERKAVEEEALVERRDESACDPRKLMMGGHLSKIRSAE
jgi:hypothetical protein